MGPSSAVGRTTEEGLARLVKRYTTATRISITTTVTTSGKFHAQADVLGRWGFVEGVVASVLSS